MDSVRLLRALTEIAPRHFLIHVGLVWSSLAIAIIIGIPLGIMLSRKGNRYFFALILHVLTILQTIPGFAFVALSIPLLGFGYRPTMIVLVFQAVLPILKGTIVGIKNIDPRIKESAIGMGMRPLGVLLEVELPLSTPYIFNGIKTSSTYVVSIATLAGFIGAGGLGVLISSGLAMLYPEYLLIGAGLSAIIALGMIYLVTLCENKIMFRVFGETKKYNNNGGDQVKKRVFAIMLSMLVLVAFVGCSNTTEGDYKGEITIGSKTFTESLVLGSVMVQYLEGLGYQVTDQTGLGETAIIRTALTSGEIDLYFEYTGTGLMQFMNHEAVFDEALAYELISEWDKENGITWLPYSPANNTYVMVVTPELAKEHDLKNVSDLARAYNEGHSITLVTAAESYERPDMMPRLMEAYDFTVPNQNRLNIELGLFYEALRNDEAQVTTGFATDGIIEREGYIPLEDDKNAFAVYNITPVVRTEILEEYPELSSELATLTELLTNEAVMNLNAKVDIEGISVEDAAKEFLDEHTLL